MLLRSLSRRLRLAEEKREKVIIDVEQSLAFASFISFLIQLSNGVRASSDLKLELPMTGTTRLQFEG